LLLLRPLLPPLVLLLLLLPFMFQGSVLELLFLLHSRSAMVFRLEVQTNSRSLLESSGPLFCKGEWRMSD
jgi:hypothetical protein